MIAAEDLWKTYDMGSEQQVHALRGVNLRIQRNEYVAIMGPSGSGKSTLMNLIGCLDTPSQGKYWLNSQLVSELDDDELARIQLRNWIRANIPTYWLARQRTMWNCADLRPFRPKSAWSVQRGRYRPWAWKPA
jgi:ABC-type methionine transport system ATPase subunit